MKKLLFLIMFLAGGELMAQNIPSHEWSAGIGDMGYESRVFFDNTSNKDYRFTGHIFADYQYVINNWLGVGMQLDWSRAVWDKSVGGKGAFYNLCFMPQVRFTYFRGDIVSLYSGIGGGLLVNGGTETDFVGRRTIATSVVDISTFACSAQWGKGCTSHWFTTAELGALLSVKSKQEIFLLGSRLISISIGYRL